MWDGSLLLVFNILDINTYISGFVCLYGNNIMAMYT